MKRNTEICKISLFIFGLRVIAIIASVISATLLQRKFLTEQWIQRGISNGFHLVYIGLTYKFPNQLTNFHGPVITLTHLSNLVSVAPGRITIPAIGNNLMGYVYFLAIGLLTNGYWVYSVTSMFIVMMGTSLYYTIYLDITETGLIFQFICLFLLMAYNTYLMEFHRKSELVKID